MLPLCGEFFDRGTELKDNDAWSANGPAWFDVEVYQEQIERLYGIQVVYVTTCVAVKGGGRRSWWVRAEARTPKQLDKPAGRAGGYGFRGNGGASTMAAAMYMALAKLDEVLGANQGVAEQRAMF